jgi:glyoxylase-like metal-dependent hydrolase (beta-lactamase superfamily II)
VKELFPNLFQLRIPLPIPALEHLNSYLVQGKSRYLLIDTGMFTDEAFGELQRQLAEIGVKPQDITDILVTHFHVDHAGLVSRLRSLSGAQLMVSAKEAEGARLASMTYESRLKNFVDFYKGAGVPGEFVEQMLKATPVRLYKAIYEELGRPSRSLKDGEEISVGAYRFRTIWTPGHSPGHICLYEPDWRLLVAGDHLLPTITPHVTQWGKEGNPLADYLDSLDKVEKLDVDAVLPGHEEPFTNHRKRVRELKEHLRSRTMEMLSELKRQELTAYQIASRIRWNVDYPSWDRFPSFQKILATGETLAHLKFLEEQNQVKKAKRAKTIFYRAF